MAKFINWWMKKKRAWHAGVAYWKGQTNINNRSIGIELMNQTGKEIYCQTIQNVIQLIKKASRQYHISSQNILAHSDIAPDRKIDPGPLFNWKYLAKKGFGVWPSLWQIFKNFFVSPDPLRNSLKSIGYDTREDASFHASIHAFCFALLSQSPANTKP